jgi:hypothetical protein
MALGLLDRPGGAEGTRRARWRTLLERCREALPRPPAAEGEPARIRRLEDARAVLDGARAVLEQHWVQNAWYVVRDRRGRLRPVGALQVGRLDQGKVAGACLVGAVVHAAWARRGTGAPAEAAPALDLLWQSLRESSGGPAEPAPARPDVRLARVRELTRWNDQSERSQQDVLALIDVASSHAIMDAVR